MSEKHVSLPMYDQLEVQQFNDIICHVIGKRLRFLLETALLKEKFNKKEQEFADELSRLEFKPNRAVVCTELWADHQNILFTHICGQLYYEKYRDSLLPIVAPIFESSTVNAATAVRTKCDCSVTTGASNRDHDDDASLYRALIISHKDKEHYYTMAGSPSVNRIGTTLHRNRVVGTRTLTGGKTSTAVIPPNGMPSTSQEAFEEGHDHYHHHGNHLRHYNAQQVQVQAHGGPFGRLAGSKVALNSLDSYSGCVSLCNAVALSNSNAYSNNCTNANASTGGCNSSSNNNNSSFSANQNSMNIFFSPEALLTGSHRSSIAAIANGRADIASIDCITWAVLQKHCPEELIDCRVIGETALAPLPPIVMSKSFAEQCPTIKALLTESIIDTFSILPDCGIADADTVAVSALDIDEQDAALVSVPSLRSMLSPEERVILSQALSALGIVGALRTSSDAYISAFEKLNATPYSAVPFLYKPSDPVLVSASDTTLHSDPFISTSLTPAEDTSTTLSQQLKSEMQSQLTEELDYMEKLDMCGYKVSFAITTSSNMARIWCNRGMLLCYGFNHDASVYCFEQALVLDPACIFAHWGAAYSYGENYNYKEVEEENMCAVREHVTKALDLLEKEEREKRENSSAVACCYTPLERALVQAVKCRSDLSGICNPVERTLLYCAAMKGLYYDENNNYSENSDIAALYAESLINIRPWKLWPPRFHRGAETVAREGAGTAHENTVNDSAVFAVVASTNLDDDDVIPAETLELGKVLNEALRRTPRHPGLVHLKVHYGELGPKDVLYGCIEQAHMLRSQWPGVGHLSHMAAHIDMQVGMYAHGVQCNIRGIEEDCAYNLYRDPSGDTNHTYHGYMIHNGHMLTWGAMFCGNFETAIKYSENAFKTTSPHMFLKYIDYMEPYMTDPWHVLIRFGKWHDILKRPIRRYSSTSSYSNKSVQDVKKGTTLDGWARIVDPELSLLDEAEEKIFIVEIAFSHYARGVAYAALGDVEKALEEQKLFRAAVQRVPSSRHLHNVTSLQTMSVAECMLAGEIAYRDGYVAAAFDHLREAAVRELTLPYDEPPGWMFPCRHALGALLLEEATGMLQEWCEANNLNSTSGIGDVGNNKSYNSRSDLLTNCRADDASKRTSIRSSNESTKSEFISSLRDDGGEKDRCSIETLKYGLDLLLEAEMCYRHDLDVYPCNLWSLVGLNTCMQQFKTLRCNIISHFDGYPTGLEVVPEREEVFVLVKNYRRQRQPTQAMMDEKEGAYDDEEEEEEEVKSICFALDKALLHGSKDIRAMFAPSVTAAAAAATTTATTIVTGNTDVDTNKDTEPRTGFESSGHGLAAVQQRIGGASCFCAGAAPRRHRCPATYLEQNQYYG